MAKIEKKIKDVIENPQKHLADIEKLKKMEEANRLFEDLVAKGWATKRGYNLLSPHERVIKNNDIFFQFGKRVINYPQQKRHINFVCSMD